MIEDGFYDNRAEQRREEWVGGVLSAALAYDALRDPLAMEGLAESWQAKWGTYPDLPVDKQMGDCKEGMLACGSICSLDGTRCRKFNCMIDAWDKDLPSRDPRCCDTCNGQDNEGEDYCDWHGAVMKDMSHKVCKDWRSED
jgi:hypothetical protein